MSTCYEPLPPCAILALALALALAQGLAVQEGGRSLGRSQAEVDRRWEVGVAGLLRGFAG